MEAKSFLVGVFTALAAAVICACCCCCCCSNKSSCNTDCVPPGCCTEECHKELEARVEKLERAKIGEAEAK